MRRAGAAGLLMLLTSACEIRSRAERQADADVKRDRGAIANEFHRDSLQLVSELRRDSIVKAEEERADRESASRMREVLGAIDEPPPSTPVQPDDSFSSTPEYREAMRYAGQGPSFDCTRSLAPFEQAICGDPIVSGLDRAVANRTGANRRAGKTMRPDDAAWRKATLPACEQTPDPTRCLRDAMVDRFRALAR